MLSLPSVLILVPPQLPAVQPSMLRHYIVQLRKAVWLPVPAWQAHHTV
ncbi:MAG: hypothetical protein LC768_08195 [Acidobacteria bacterium]|nr:hypothetical protein [Acidobacteriota bacterium]MCA1638300.1 hypothetical protein [Acidobacteriota bacterium]